MVEEYFSNLVRPDPSFLNVLATTRQYTGQNNPICTKYMTSGHNSPICRQYTTPVRIVRSLCEWQDIKI